MEKEGGWERGKEGKKEREARKYQRFARCFAGVLQTRNVQHDKSDAMCRASAKVSGRDCLAEVAFLGPTSQACFEAARAEPAGAIAAFEFEHAGSVPTSLQPARHSADGSRGALCAE